MAVFIKHVILTLYQLLHRTPLLFLFLHYLFIINATKHDNKHTYKMKRKLMPTHLVYIMLFSYFCVACENSEFCYYISSHNSFDFSREDCSMGESYAICELQNAINEKPAKNRSTHFSFFALSHFVIEKNVCYTLSVQGASLSYCSIYEGCLKSNIRIHLTCEATKRNE